MQDIKNAIEHLKTHQTYPASREELVKACEDLKDFSKEDKEWFKQNLPEGTYQSAQDVIGVLGLQRQAQQMSDDNESSIQTPNSNI